jgi:N-sulfoglucosamine sulfohydrolase
MDGRSFVPLLQGTKQAGWDQVFTQFNHIHGKNPYPMRCVQNARFGYIFNPWSNGQRKYFAEPLIGLTYPAMKEAARTDEGIARRVKMLEYRTVEEFYDYQQDPDALHNLIDEPQLQGEIDQLRGALRLWMEQHHDPALSALEGRQNPAALEEFMTEYSARAASEIEELRAYELKTGYEF